MAIQASGAATKTETHATLIPGGGAAGSSLVTSSAAARGASAAQGALVVQFVLRQCSALSAKPQGPPSTSSAPSAAPSPGPGSSSSSSTLTHPQPAKQPWRNPFLPYEEELWVQHLSPTHTLLLNKVWACCVNKVWACCMGWDYHHVIAPTNHCLGLTSLRPAVKGDVLLLLRIIQTSLPHALMSSPPSTPPARPPHSSTLCNTTSWSSPGSLSLSRTHQMQGTWVPHGRSYR